MAEASPGRAPLDPKVLVFASFLLGPLGAGVALAVNDNRLGNKERAPLTFYAFFFFALFCYLAVARLHAEHVFALGSRAGWLAARAVEGWLTVAVAFLWSGPARAAWARARAQGARPGNPLPVCMPALLAGVALDMVVWQLFVRPQGA